MHICYCHKQLQKPRVSAPFLLSAGGLCAVLCGHQKDLAGFGWAWGTSRASWGRDFLFL